MYIKKKYSGRTMMRWTRREIRFFIVMATIVTILYDILGFHFLQIPWAALALIGTAVAFLIGFQSNAVYGRIWEARTIWGAIVNDSRMFTIMVKEMITNEYAQETASENELKEIKRTIVHRHIAWLTALRHAMRQVKPWESYRLNKRNEEWLNVLHIPELEISMEDDLNKHLSEEEYSIVMSKTNKAAAILTLQSSHIRELKERGLIWEFSFLEMQSKISELIGHQGKSERIKNFPYPRQFATLGYTSINLFNMLLPFGIVPEFHKLGESLIDKFPIIGDYFVWLAIPFTVLVSWVFNTMQRIGTVGENPFEGSSNDVPISTISRGIEIDILEMIDTEKEQIPGPVPADFDVQM